MKGVFYLNVFFLFITFFTSGCKKEDSQKDIAPIIYGSVTDVENNIYKTITIGNQTWMAENLKTTKFNDSTVIPNITDDALWALSTSAAYCWYNNDSNNKATYGALYNWYAINTGKLCPKGWHVPTDIEWTTLENYLIAHRYNFDGTTTGNKYAKTLASDTGWIFFANVGAVGNTDFSSKKNETGFSALPGGFRNFDGSFHLIGYNGEWWSSSEDNFYGAYNRAIWSAQNYVYKFGNYKSDGFSVRCIKD